MKNNIDLSSLLKKYSATAASILTASAANAQIGYTDVSPDLVVSSPGSYNLDLDGNSVTDFVINAATIGSSYSSTARIDITPTPGNSFVGSGAYVAALINNMNVGPTQNWLSTPNNIMGQNQYNYYFAGLWVNTTDRFLGLKFKIGTNTHYGWARLDVNLACTQFVVKD